jgi:RimJ/RimL family protein N-acetyltransferase
MTRSYFLEGKRISLTGLSERDLEETAPYFRWMNDLHMDVGSERSRFVNDPKVHRAYADIAAQRQSLVFLGIYETESGRHIGNVSLKDINWHSRHGVIGYMIGEPQFTRKGIATEAVGMFVLYAFQKLNLNRIHTTVALDNAGSMKVLENNGFQKEGVMREHVINGTARFDVAVLGALADEWLPAHAERVRSSYKTAPF